MVGQCIGLPSIVSNGWGERSVGLDQEGDSTTVSILFFGKRPEKLLRPAGSRFVYKPDTTRQPCGLSLANGNRMLLTLMMN